MDYEFELEQPDISGFAAGNCGIDYVYDFPTNQDGPHLWLNAITHGDEVCGAIALSELLQSGLRPDRGRLTVSFANIAAFNNTSKEYPLGTRFKDEDMNRVWDKLDGVLDSYEKRRAKELEPIALTADYLIDIHAMHHPSEPLTIVGMIESPQVTARGKKLSRMLGYPSLLVSDAGHAAGCRLRDFHSFGEPDARATSLVVECGGFWQNVSADVARWVVFQALHECGVMDTKPAQATPPVKNIGDFRLVEASHTITIQTDDFAFTQPVADAQVVPAANTLIARDGDLEIRTPFDDCFLMFPTRKPTRGETAVRMGRFSEL